LPKSAGLLLPNFEGAKLLLTLPECAGFMGLPFTVYYKNGEVVTATTSIQNEGQIRGVLDAQFGG
jgi:thioredoxin 1